MSIIQIEREMEAAFRHGDLEELERLSVLLHRVRTAKAAIVEAGETRRAGRAKGFLVRKRGVVFGKRGR